MTYLRRSLRYFLYLVIILCIIIGVLVASGLVEADLQKMFVNGYDSLWQIALIIAVFAALYPRFGFGKREALAPGEYGDIIGGVLDVMDHNGYRSEKREGENLTFRKRSPIVRMVKMGEDRITLTRTATGFTVEGLTRDIVRIASGIETKFTSADE